MILTPKKLGQRAEFYHQIGTMTEAGLSLLQSLESLNRSRHFHFSQPIPHLIKGLEKGESFTEASANLRNWLPAFDLSLFESGEQSGRLDVCFRLLSDFYRQRERALRKIISHLLYPLLIVHVAILLYPFPDLFLTGNVALYLTKIGSVFIPFYSASFIIFYLTQGQHGAFLRSVLERIFSGIPLIGNGQKALSLSRFCLALQSLLNAGTNIAQAWNLAAAASGSTILQREVALYESRIQGGYTPGELLKNATYFPEIFVSLYQGGEVSGRIDENLKRLRAHFQDEAFRKFELFATWFPNLIYLVIIVVIAMRIIGFWQDHIGGIGTGLDF